MNLLDGYILISQTESSSSLIICPAFVPTLSWLYLRAYGLIEPSISIGKQQRVKGHSVFPIKSPVLSCDQVMTLVE